MFQICYLSMLLAWKSFHAKFECVLVNEKLVFYFQLSYEIRNTGAPSVICVFIYIYYAFPLYIL